MKGFLKFIIGLILIIVIIVGGFYVALIIPKKVNVTWTEKDLQSYMDKAHANIGNAATSDTKPASLDDLLLNNFKSIGKVAVEGTVTSAEATAMINTVARAQGLFKDLKMNFRDDGTVEVSCYLGSAVDEIIKLAPEVAQYRNIIKQFEGKPIYFRGSLERLEDKKFDGHTLELKAGQIPVPLSATGQGLTEAGTFLNEMIAKIDGFTCQQLSIDSQGFHFKGTLPETLQSVDPNILNTKW